VPTPKTLASLASLPCWTIDTGPADYADARWTGHGVTIAITYEADTEDWDIRFGERGQMTLSHETDATEADAVAFALSLVAIVTTAAAHALATAAPPPPTTIAELATRPGWRLDDGDAIHDGAYITAGPNIVELGLGDRVHALDEREAAEVAFAVAPLIAAAHVRYNANPGQE
jgi:hypothetical protein